MYGIVPNLIPSQVRGIYTEAGAHIYHTVLFTYTKRNQ
jgi:hypothetical protein